MPARGKGKGYNGYKWIRKGKRYAIYIRDDFTCLWCLTKPERLSLDHLIPWSQGGNNHESNLISCCFRCNSVRGNIPWIEYANYCDSESYYRILRQIKLPLNIHMGKELAEAQKKKPWRVPAAMEDRSFQHVIDVKGYKPIEEVDDYVSDIPF